MATLWLDPALSQHGPLSARPRGRVSEAVKYMFRHERPRQNAAFLPGHRRRGLPDTCVAQAGCTSARAVLGRGWQLLLLAGVGLRSIICDHAGRRMPVDPAALGRIVYFACTSVVGAVGLQSVCLGGFRSLLRPLQPARLSPLDTFGCPTRGQLSPVRSRSLHRRRTHGKLDELAVVSGAGGCRHPGIGCRDSCAAADSARLTPGRGRRAVGDKFTGSSGDGSYRFVAGLPCYPYPQC